MGRKPEVILENKRMHIDFMLSKAENANMYNTQTENNNFGYIYDDGWIAVVVPTGVIRMKLENARQFAHDFAEICDELTDLRIRRILE